ncbi:glutamate--tRNA ligase [Candidatus Woesearchaeota archaeon]|nr:glutamate--tRNA ligase [Candidatus Woesearchaeota archaeon]
MDIKKLARKWALQNAVKYNGKADVGAVIGKLIAEDPKIKPQLGKLMKDIKTIIEDVNFTPTEKQRQELENIAPELLEEKHETEERILKPLPNAIKGKVIMRFAPSPSGPLHIGHAYVASLNSEYCRLYDGEFIWRIEDTDADKIYPPAYEIQPKEAQWITKNNVKKVFIQSDRLHTYYDYAEKLLNKGHAYVCTCTQDEFKALSQKKKECQCRNLPVKENLSRWDKMFTTFQQGQAVVRIKTDMQHPNPAMHDWPALRINCTKHARTGTEERVWPLMNFAVAIDDHEMGITHAIRAKEHMDNEKKQKYVYDAFGWKTPTNLYVGRINFIGLDVSKTKTKEKIERGEYTGWDDIRLPFLASLKRRGYQPDAFINWAIDVGVTETDKTITAEDFFKSLNHFNKAIIDQQSNRYFFVWDPAKVTVQNAPVQTIKLDMHPDNPKKGKRTFKTKTDFYLTRDDYEALKQNKLYRLMDCLNFVRKKDKLLFESQKYEDYKERGEAIMHWLPVEEKTVQVEVLMPDATVKKGVGEAKLSQLKVGEIVQLERLGFCKLDAKEKGKLIFWYAHR